MTYDLTVASMDIQLDEYGRVILDDSHLEELSRHYLSQPLAGGSNAACHNNGCSNYGCSSSSQTNSSCINTSCGGNTNSRCQNRIDEGGA